VARFRLSDLARLDVAAILKTSASRHGEQARIRYRGLVSAAFQRIAAEPECPFSSSREEIAEGLRSLHLRHCKSESQEAPVASPVHIVFFRRGSDGQVEIIRVLHERMELSRHLTLGSRDPTAR
jgi:toxin ParE1/3/4